MKNYLVFDEAAQFYECGFCCDNAVVIVIGDQRYFITDPRYSLEASEQSLNTEVIESDDLIASARKIIRKSGAKQFVIDCLDIHYQQAVDLTSKLPHIHFRYSKRFHDIRRAVKRADETQNIKNAVAENRVVFSTLAAFISENREKISENDLYIKAKELLQNNHKREMSFDPILAISENGAKPHAKPSERELLCNDTILFDAGTKYKRYCSDRTRTAVYSDHGLTFETDQRFSDQNKQKIYDLVLKAHDHAINQARAGMRAKELDQIARQVIEGGGYGEFFTHSLGHGV